jgi:hypothetical protein
LFNRNLKSIAAKRDVNMDKAASLEKYVDSLENKIHQLTMAGPSRDSKQEK